MAPIALIAVIVATVLVIESRNSAVHHNAPVRRLDRRVVAGHPAAPRIFYVVQAGDSLSTISVKTRVPVPTLESLNPAVSPNSLQTGQRLRLR